MIPVLTRFFVALCFMFYVFASGDIYDAQESDRTPIPSYASSPQPNTTVMYDRLYHQLVGTTPIYDAPDGNQIRVIDEGFNFVTIFEQTPGWLRINQGQWIRADDTTPANVVSSFTGFFFDIDEYPDEPDVIIAWALVNMYPSRTPGASPDGSQSMIYRYTPLAITEEKVVDGIRWYKVGKNQWVHQHRVAKIEPLIDIPDGVETTRWIAMDLYEQVLIAYEGTMPVFATLVATGLPRWPTYEGIFNIYYRTQRTTMTWGVVGDDYYFLQEVPWTMYFDEGRALHGAYWHDGFGYRRSHGCVNLSLTDAKWLYDWVAEAMGSRASADVEEGLNVYVYSSDEY